MVSLIGLNGKKDELEIINTPSLSFSPFDPNFTQTGGINKFSKI